MTQFLDLSPVFYGIQIWKRRNAEGMVWTQHTDVTAASIVHVELVSRWRSVKNIHGCQSLELVQSSGKSMNFEAKEKKLSFIIHMANKLINSLGQVTSLLRPFGFAIINQCIKITWHIHLLTNILIQQIWTLFNSIDQIGQELKPEVHEMNN